MKSMIKAVLLTVLALPVVGQITTIPPPTVQGGGAGGTVTNVAAGNFSPLFNTSISSPTLSPNISFAGISQTQNQIFASPNGASGPPGFRTMVTADTTGITVPWSNIANPGAIQSLSMGTFGTTLTATDPTTGDPNNGTFMTWACNYDQNSTINSGASKNCFELNHNHYIGQGLIGAGTTGKTTVVTVQESSNYYGSGQKALEGKFVNCYGMSDCSIGQSFITTSGGPIAGDEGQGFVLHSRLKQPDGPISTTTITSVPARSGCPSNMTLTQSVTQSLSVQTVTVSSSTGCLVNDWVVADWNGPTGTPNWDYVQITAVGAGTISGKFLANHSNGATVRSAVWFSHSNPLINFGQDRVVVDMSGSSYNTGTAATSGGCGLPSPSFCSTNQIGTGTAWTTGIVGGDTNDPGCFSYTGDNQSGYSSFTVGNPLISWWEILTVTDNTHLNLFSYSTSGAGFYGGVGTGAYVIRPCARVLYVNQNGSLVVLAPNTFTWTNGDTLQQPYVPYVDTLGFQWDMGFYSPGAITRGFVQYQNIGSQQINCVICVINGMTGNTTMSSPSAFHSIISTGNFASNPVVDYVIDAAASAPADGAFLLHNRFTASGDYEIKWGSGTCTDRVSPPDACIGFPPGQTTLFIVGNGQRYIGFDAGPNSPNTQAYLFGLQKLVMTRDVTTPAVTLTMDMSNVTHDGVSRTYTFSNQTGQIGLWIATTTVGSLPACSSDNPGTYTFVTDANAVTLGSIVAGGGANRVPVKCDGTNWRIG